jgi:hypothetical protein
MVAEIFQKALLPEYRILTAGNCSGVFLKLGHHFAKGLIDL